MAEQKRRYKAEIAGKTYTIIGPGTPAHFAAVTALLNQQLDQLHRLAPTLTTEDAAVLLAFNAVSDQVKEKAQRQLADHEDDE